MFDSGVSTGPAEPRKQYWERCFAWLPVRVHGKRKWLTTVWRKPIMAYGDSRFEPPMWEYGNVFDVIKDE